MYNHILPCIPVDYHVPTDICRVILGEDRSIIVPLKVMAQGQSF